MSRLASLVGYHWSWEIAEVRYTTRVITKPRLLTSLKNDGASWTWTKDYIWGPTGLLATVSPKEGTKHYVNDHLGSPRLVCDRGAHTLAKHNYYPYGEESTYAYLDREPIKFTGHERDLNNGRWTTDDLDYMHARYYTFNLGRFMSVDPIGGSIGSSQSWNRYSYVHGNPVNLIDPWGLATNQYNGEGQGLHLAEAILFGDTTVFFDNVTVTASNPDVTIIPLHSNDPIGNMMAMMLYMDITGWHGYSYADPYREMLRVAGGGVPHSNGPTFDDYLSWFGESYYDDMLHRGVLFAGAGAAIDSPLGVSGSAAYGDGKIARTIAMNTPVLGASAFVGAGLRFGSISGPVSTKIVFTAASLTGVRIVYSTGFSGDRQFQLLVGFGGGASMSVTGSPAAISW